MPSKMHIINCALANLGQESIASLNENDKSAFMLRTHYDTALGDLLSSHSWGFAKRRAVLAPLQEKPLGFDQAYAYPADCVRLLRVIRADAGDRRGRVRFEIGRSADGRAKAVWTNCPPVAWGEYTSRMAQPEEFPDKFAEAFAWRLSAAIALGVHNDPSTWQTHMQTYNLLRAEARAADAAEGAFAPMPEGDFLASREY